MTLRTPNPYRSYQSILDLQRSKERMAVFQDQITKDKRITRLSDDPTGAALIMDFQNSIERNKAYVRQGQSASSFLKGTESSLNMLVTQMDRLLELGQQGLSDLTGATGRVAISAEVDVILNTILDIANTKEQGKYIFAGTNTALPAGTMPFDLVPTNPTLWTVPNTAATQPAVAYSGNRGNIDLDISSVTTVTTNLSGAYVFQGDTSLDPDQDIFIAVAQLRDGLANNDSDLIRQAYDNIRSLKNRIDVCLTTVGSRQTSIENTGTNLEDFNLALQSIQNTYDGLDYPWTISRMYAEQASYEAGLSVLSRMGRMNLFDYIG